MHVALQRIGFSCPEGLSLLNKKEKDKNPRTTNQGPQLLMILTGGLVTSETLAIHNYSATKQLYFPPPGDIEVED